MDRTDTGRPLLRSGLAATLAAALTAALLAGCGTASAPGRPHANRPESSNAKTPGTPRNAGTPAHGGRQGVPRPGGAGKGGKVPGRSTPASRTPRQGSAGRPRSATSATGLAGTASGLYNWGLGRPPGGLGGALGRGGTTSGRTAGGRHTIGHPAGRATGTSTETGARMRRPATRRPRDGMRAGRASTGSPYNNAVTRALADRQGGAHRQDAGVYKPPPGHRRGQPLTTPDDLTTLPTWTSLEHFNGYLVSYSHLTPWVTSMGAHWGHRGPGLVLMQNENHQVTAAETGFPASAGWHPWYDQPQGKPAGPIYSEHMYFVPPASITKTMPTNQATDLTSWQTFSQANGPRLAQYKPVGRDPTGRATQYGPPGTGIRVLVDGPGHVVGLVAAWPSNSPQGWRPWFDQAQGTPIQDPQLGSVYTQHLWLVDPRALPSATTSTGSTGSTSTSGSA